MITSGEQKTLKPTFDPHSTTIRYVSAGPRRLFYQKMFTNQTPLLVKDVNKNVAFHGKVPGHEVW